MPRRLLVIAVAAFALLAGAGCADDVSPAVRVGDLKIGNDAFLAEVAEWAGNPAAVDPATLGDVSPGTYPLELARQLMQQRIDFALHNEEFEALSLKLDDAMREQGIISIFGDPAAAEQAFSAFSKEFTVAFTDDLARQVAVQTELGEGYPDWRTKAYAAADIEISPRYGTWDSATGEVVAPAGPTQPATTVPAGP